MSDANDGQEPTMEEILASIRRIITEEGDGKSAPKPAAATPPPRPAPRDEEPMELTQMVADDGTVVNVGQPAPPPPPPAPKPAPKPAMPAPKPQLAPPPPPPPPAPRPAPQPMGSRSMADDLTSQIAQRATVGAFAQLQHAVETSHNPPNYDDPGPGAGGQTIEGMVYMILKPMLREWVDRNLPVIVERMVAREIEKMTGGR